MNYPYYQAGDHSNIQPDDPTFATYAQTLKYAQKKAKEHKDEGTCGAVYAVWKHSEWDTLPDLVTLITYEGVFVRDGWQQ